VQSMRDIRGDLQDRLNMVAQQINAERTQFDTLIAQLEREHDSRLEDMRAQLQAVNRLIAIAIWRHNVLFTVARALALAAAVEISLTAPQCAHPQNALAEG
jgi:hypothetical protein